MRKVRIQRKAKGLAQRNFALAGLMMTLAKMAAKYAGGTYQDALQAAKLEQVRKHTQVLEMNREIKSNQLVIQDLEIMKRKQDLGIPEPGMDFRPTDYEG